MVRRSATVNGGVCFLTTSLSSADDVLASIEYATTSAMMLGALITPSLPRDRGCEIANDLVGGEIVSVFSVAYRGEGYVVFERG